MTTSVTSAPANFRGVFRTDADALAVYSEAAGIARILPRAVAVPLDAADVVTLARWARAVRVPLIPRGSGSGMAGGAIGDGIVVDLSRLRDISAVDAQSGTITVGPGVTWKEVDDLARASGMRFPPDPSSGAFCSVGGMVSTNASGAHTLKYGPTRSWVRSLDCVFDDGSRATLRRGVPPRADVPALQRFSAIASGLSAADAIAPSVHAGVRKDSSGYGVNAFARSGDVVDILIGSEGTLAIVVGIELALATTPAATSSLIGSFATLESAVTAAGGARGAGASACELLDRTFLNVAASAGPLPNVAAGCEAVLMAEVEGANDDDAHAAVNALADLFRRAGAVAVHVALTPADEHAMWELRHAASPILARLGPSLTSMQFVEDGAVPPEKLAEYVRGVREILDAHEVKGVIFGHAGDSHIHVNPLIDVSRAGWRDVMSSMLMQVVTLTARLGGTLDGEHGDGRLRAPLLDSVWPHDIMERFRAVKLAFDPDGIFNLGAKIALAGEQPVCDIKYDPALPQLPRRAAAALARVSDERAYAVFRLDMLDDQS
ncbi:MAG: FAD-binding oxidoreductase [Gemmatimonadota bacterium]|nr:FAD-binding oxidoreductase [Gemmatimonadota bacterium]